MLILLLINKVLYLFNRLNSSDKDGEPMYIQMVTALVLQLIQCVVHLPSGEKDSNSEEESNKKVNQFWKYVIVSMFRLATDVRNKNIIIGVHNKEVEKEGSEETFNRRNRLN